jgi:YHS domain-containing protein
MRTATALLVLIFASAALADEREHANLGKDRLAVKGYDVVSYHDGKPLPGNGTITAEHDGAVYRFATAANRDKFLADPVKYAPAYGGWCATAVALKNSKVDIDPTNYRLTNGRLFLFYKGLLGDAVKPWVKDEPGNTAKADTNWKKIVEGK